MLRGDLRTVNFGALSCHIVQYNKPAQNTARGLQLFLQPARAFSIVENVVKVRPRISNCRSKLSSILQRNLHMKWDILAARGKFMWIIWPFELSELCRPVLQTTWENQVKAFLWQQPQQLLLNSVNYCTERSHFTKQHLSIAEWIHVEWLAIPSRTSIPEMTSFYTSSFR